MTIIVKSRGPDMNLSTFLQLIDEILLEHGDPSTLDVSVSLDPKNQELLLVVKQDIIGHIKFHV